MDEDQEEVPSQSVGRGRGRGGGVPVLPAGLWNELNGSENRRGADIDSKIKNLSETVDQKDDKRGIREEDFAPVAFGRGLGRGRGRGRGGPQIPGRGFVKDAKGADWECTVCSNVNWSWRANCNKCQTAKPITLQVQTEVRDGIGGGFNERQDRVSNTTVEITEDGFDDFGRRAKGRAFDRSAKEAAALARLQTNYAFLLDPAVVPGSVPSSDEPKRGGDGKRFEDADEDSMLTGVRTRVPFGASDSKGAIGGSVGVGSGNGGHGEDRKDGRGRDREGDRDKDKDRDKDRGRDRDRDRDGDRRERVRERDRESERDRDRDNRDRNKQRDKDRERDKEGEKGRDRDKDRERERERRGRSRSRSRSKDRERRR